MSNVAEKVTALITCVTEPSPEQLEGLKRFVLKETGAADAELVVKKDNSLLGGFIIQIGNKQYDRSLKSRLQALGAEVTVAARRCTDLARTQGAVRKPGKRYLRWIYNGALRAALCRVCCANIEPPNPAKGIYPFGIPFLCMNSMKAVPIYVNRSGFLRCSHPRRKFWSSFFKSSRVLRAEP